MNRQLFSNLFLVAVGPVMLLFLCASGYADTGVISYWGATSADYLSGLHGTGDVDDLANFTDHPNYWDYCYKLEYSNWQVDN